MKWTTPLKWNLTTRTRLSTVLLDNPQQLEPQLLPPNQSSQDISTTWLVFLFFRVADIFWKTRASSRFATLGDLRSKSNDDEDDSEDEKRDLFTGGEKS